MAATVMVYDAVRAGILQGRYRPNERLIELSIAEELGTSRTPVREALQRLAAGGLIVGGRQGWAVKEFTAVEIREIFEVRITLEGFATGLAASRASPEQLSVIEDVHRRELSLAPGYRHEQVALNDEFHRRILEAAGNSRMVRFWERNLDYYFNRPIAVLLSEEEVIATIAEHSRIVAALRDGRPDEAEQAGRDHVTRSLSLALRALGQDLTAD